MSEVSGPGSLRRNRAGMKAADVCRWSDEVFDEMESTLAVQQYIQQMIRVDNTKIEEILEPPEVSSLKFLNCVLGIAIFFLWPGFIKNK